MKKMVGLLLALFVCSSAFAAPFNQIVFFGDSLSDDGNLYQATKKTVPKSPPYYQGRFSNGPTWAEDLGKKYYDKYYIGTINDSYGGATAILHDPKTDSFTSTITLEGELYSYSLHSMFVDKSKVLYVIWIGANDYLYEKTPDMSGVTDAVVNKIASSITSLINQGANQFLILNLPDLAKTPYAQESGQRDRLHTFSEMHNQKLNDKMNELKNQYPTIKLVTVSAYDILNDLLANPEKYNQQYNKSFKDMTQPCLTDESLLKNSSMNKANLSYTTGTITICGNANEHVFWDIIHPTADVHEILGAIVMQQLANVGEG